MFMTLRKSGGARCFFLASLAYEIKSLIIYQYYASSIPYYKKERLPYVKKERLLPPLWAVHLWEMEKVYILYSILIFISILFHYHFCLIIILITSSWSMEGIDEGKESWKYDKRNSQTNFWSHTYYSHQKRRWILINFEINFNFLLISLKTPRFPNSLAFRWVVSHYQSILFVERDRSHRPGFWKNLSPPFFSDKKFSPAFFNWKKVLALNTMKIILWVYCMYYTPMNTVGWLEKWILDKFNKFFEKKSLLP